MAEDAHVAGHAHAAAPDTDSEKGSHHQSLKSLQPLFTKDFILISEFSELEGPVPISVIPEGVHGGFNLNEFVLRIMSSDYTNKNSDISKYSLPDTFDAHSQHRSKIPRCVSWNPPRMLWLMLVLQVAFSDGTL